MSKYRVVIVDDHPLFRGALHQALSNGFDDLDVSEIDTLDELHTVLDATPDLDLVLLDLTMPGVRGLSALMFLRAQYPEVPIVIVSGTEHPDVICRCLQFGASGFIPKSCPVGEIRHAVRHVLNGEIWSPPGLDIDERKSGVSTDLVSRLATLTPQEIRVLGKLEDGLLNKQIAYELDIAVATVKSHVSGILRKLGVDNRTQAVIAMRTVDLSDLARETLGAG